jgi:ribosome-binding protein aMBF1 (putative translation factor)
MSAITIDDNELKALLKQALIELLEEKSDLFYEALAEVIEESGLVKAIKEGQASPTIDKARVLEALEQES